MSLIRCTQLLSRKNGNLLNLFKHSTVYYSDDKKSSDDENAKDETEKTNTKNDKQPTIKIEEVKQTKGATKSISPDSQAKLNNLLKRLSSRSTFAIVKDIQTSKPQGYRNVLQKQNRDAKDAKPKSLTDAAKAVSDELGDENVQDEILAPYGAEKNGNDFLENVISTMKTPAKRKDKGPNALVGSFKDKNATQGVKEPHKRRQPLSQKEIENALNDIRFGERKDNRNAKQVDIGDLFGGKPLGIFDNIDQLEVKEDPLKIWNKLEKYELRLRMSSAPRNYFEKMAYWTEEGKIWQFPIDNEQGLDEELQTSFTEHIFLDEYIEPWCPKKGAVHNFMELVCIGLSKNPYLSVQQKHEHLDWYRNYFEEKRDILQRVIEESKSAQVQVSDGTTTS